jgi:hypothetical protein
MVSLMETTLLLALTVVGFGNQAACIPWSYGNEDRAPF